MTVVLLQCDASSSGAAIRFFHEKHIYDTKIEIVFRVFISSCLELCATKCCRKNLIIFPHIPAVLDHRLW